MQRNRHYSNISMLITEVNWWQKHSNHCVICTHKQHLHNVIPSWRGRGDFFCRYLVVVFLCAKLAILSQGIMLTQITAAVSSVCQYFSFLLSPPPPPRSSLAAPASDSSQELDPADASPLIWNELEEDQFWIWRVTPFQLSYSIAS